MKELNFAFKRTIPILLGYITPGHRFWYSAAAGRFWLALGTFNQYYRLRRFYAVRYGHISGRRYFTAVSHLDDLVCEQPAHVLRYFIY